LGAPQWYVDKWNLSDLTEATLGIDKDKKVVTDPCGPRNTVQHLGQLKQAVRDFDNAWHHANNNVLVSFLSESELFSSCRIVFNLDFVDISS
jgi:hypothetical protein